jgi:hypothetical protein
MLKGKCVERRIEKVIVFVVCLFSFTVTVFVVSGVPNEIRYK